MKERIVYIDAMRGFAMFLVVVGHVLLASFGIYSETFISSFFCGELMLPLFFMISGFFSVRNINEVSYKGISCKLINKIPVLLFSPLIFLAIFCAFNNVNYIQAIETSSKGGYWFTISLFQFMLIGYVLDLVSKAVGLKNRGRSIVYLLMLGGVICLLPVIDKICYANRFLYGLFGIGYLRYLGCYFFGALIRLNYGRIVSLLSKGKFVGLAIFIILAYYSIIHVYTVKNQAILYVASCPILFCCLYVTFAVFYKYKMLSEMSCIGKSLSYMGRHTLEIYFLHYFFVHMQLQEVGEFFLSHPMPLIEFVTSAFVAVLVVIASIFTGRIIAINPFLAKLFFAEKERREIRTIY